MLKVKSIFIILGFFCSPLFGNDSPLLKQISLATSSYDNGEFDKAIYIYEDLIKHGHINGYIFYNLANAYYRKGDKSDAMAAYLAARNYLPRDPDIKANLNYVKAGLLDNLTFNFPKPAWYVFVFWIDSFTIKEQLYLFSSFFGLGFLFLAIFIFTKNRFWLRGLGIASIIISIFLAGGLIIKYTQNSRWAAALSDVVDIYSGPNKQTNRLLFKIHEAAPLLITEEIPGWYKIKLSDGKKGWAESKDIKTYL